MQPITRYARCSGLWALKMLTAFLFVAWSQVGVGFKGKEPLPLAPSVPKPYAFADR